MGMVLHFQFPQYLGDIVAGANCCKLCHKPYFTKLIHRAFVAVFKPLVAAIHGLVALECAGLTGGFYVAWTFEVVVVPCVLWGCVLLYYLCRVATVGHKAAAAKVRKTPSWPRSWANFSLL